MTKPHYYIKTFGCQMNKFDSAEFARFFESAGLSETGDPAEASLIHINTCCVRQKAEDKFFSFLGEMRCIKEKNNSLIIGVSGCIPELRDVAKTNSYVDYVVGSRAPERYFGEIEKLIAARVPDAHAEADEAGRAHGPVSSYLTIIRGCTNMCTYCVVPHVRGPEISRPVADIREDAKRLVDSGAKEIILLGQNVLAYGLDMDPKATLLDAIAAVHDIPGLERVRFVTSHPAWVTEDFLRGLSSFPKVCEHFHVPCQAGDDDILKRMNRRYTADEYAEKVALIRDYFPAAGITADVIVGFPGETEEQFERTVELMQRAVVSQAYIFRYSVRPGTVAERMADDVPHQDKIRRLLRLNEVQREISVRLNRALIESKLEVMVDGDSQTAGRFKGRTRCNRIADFSSSAELKPGDIVKVLIKSATPHAVIGEHVI